MSAWTSGERSVAGFETRRPFSRASRETSLSARRMPRPDGRSGCVSTSATSWPAAATASRERAANAGVPAKTTRKKSGGLALALLELRADAVLLQVREVLDE